ncbi:MAG: response regulator [Pirellulaceae bacterium]
MLTKRKFVHRSNAHVCSTTNKPSQCIGDPCGGGDSSVCWQPRALIIEYRDEVYAGLKRVLEEAGFQVERGRVGATAAARIRQFEPDLILVNEELPDESGWLMTCKLRLTRRTQPIWLYTVRRPRWRADWREFLGVDEVIEYRGVLAILLQQVRQRLVDRCVSPPFEPARHPLGFALPSAVA